MRKSILVIDDEVVWHRLLTRVLRELGYDVYTAATCAEGVRLAGLQKPDCIVLDFHLTDGDAVLVCAALKANEQTAGIPVVVFSSDPAAEITAYAECKAAYFVLKGTRSITDLPLVIGSVLSSGISRNLIVEA
mgnify:CR=1 FL=1